jgi:putative ABC transport system permease protein
MIPLYVATPEVLAHLRISPGDINPNADIISSRNGLRGLELFAPVFSLSGDSARSPKQDVIQPVIQEIRGLPLYGSDPGTLITAKGLQRAGLEPIPTGWLIQTTGPLTQSQIASARQTAAASGLYMETRHPERSLAPLRNWATTAGLLLALGVLAITVGLIRSETANDLRTLAAIGASGRTRRNLTAATAGSLALLGALLGTAGAYAALLAWHRSDLTPLGHAPVLDLVLILGGLPLVAVVGGWLLAGREVPEIARRPLE